MSTKRLQGRFAPEWIRPNPKDAGSVRAVFEELRLDAKKDNPKNFWVSEDWIAPHILLWANSNGLLEWKTLQRFIKYGFDYITIFGDNDLWLRGRTQQKTPPKTKKELDPNNLYGDKWVLVFLEIARSVDALLLKAEKIPRSRTAERSRLLTKALGTSFDWDAVLSERVEPNSVRATYEREVANDPEFRKSIKILTDHIPAKTKWVYMHKTQRLHIRGQNRDAVEKKYKKVLPVAQKHLNEICNTWCLAQISSFSGSCETLMGIRFDAENVVVTPDKLGRGISVWIPSYLGFEQIPEHRDTDFRPLYQAMRQVFGGSRKFRSDGGVTRKKLDELKSFHNDLVNAGTSKAKAWDAAFDKSGWSDETFRTNFGDRPDNKRTR